MPIHFSTKKLQNIEDKTLLTVLHYVDQHRFPSICGELDDLWPNAVHNLEKL